MKKFFALLIMCALVLVTGCGGGDKPADKPAGSPDEFKLGMITHLNATEQKMTEIYNDLVKKSAIKLPNVKVKFYNSLSTMQMGLESGDANEISTYKCVANYLVAGNNKYELPDEQAFKNLADQFCFAVRQDDTALKADLNKAIDAMREDGTLSRLVKVYITDAKADNIPAVEIPHVDGAQTLKVGVTGDLPPLDLIMPDGKPAGFNTAMLAEIAKRLNKNIELVQVDSGARGAALIAKKIDVIFWAIIPDGENMPADIDTPEGVELTVPYFKDDITHVKLKK